MATNHTALYVEGGPHAPCRREYANEGTLQNKAVPREPEQGAIGRRDGEPREVHAHVADLGLGGCVSSLTIIL